MFDYILLAYCDLPRYHQMRRHSVSHVSRWPPTKHKNYESKIVKLIVMFTAPPLQWYVTCNTHNPRWKTFHLENWDISLLFTHFSLLFPAQGSESHIFCLLGVGKSEDVYRALHPKLMWGVSTSLGGRFFFSHSRWFSIYSLIRRTSL